jgi:transcriptional regulator with XRE-family HTH domain
MSGQWLTDARRRKGWTQQQAAAKLGVSQTYLSLLEHGRRPVTPQLLSKLQRHFDVPATELPVEASKRKGVDAQELARALGALGYPGFAHLASKRLNPALVLLMALREPNLETRLLEALPWVVVGYPNLDWEWLFEQAKVHDVQNRLGFVLTLSRKVAQSHREHSASAPRLAVLEQRLERSRLAREDTLCRESMTSAERNWLRRHRSPEAQHWNLLTDLTAESLEYGD